MTIDEAKPGVKIRVRDTFNAIIDDPAIIHGGTTSLVMYRIESPFGDAIGHGSEKPERCEILKDKS